MKSFHTKLTKDSETFPNLCDLCALCVKSLLTQSSPRIQSSDSLAPDQFGFGNDRLFTVRTDAHDRHRNPCLFFDEPEIASRALW